MGTDLQRPAAFLILCALAACVTGAGAGHPPRAPAAAAPPIDHQHAADGARWNWSDEQADPLYSLSQAGNKYDIVMVSDHRDRSALTFKILDGGKEICSWRGHRHSAFRLLRNRLYYARFNPAGSGGAVVAVDLTSGKELWQSDLRALGPVSHSGYRSRIAIDANDDVVWVFGNESQGKYLEFKDVRTGKTVGHRVFADVKEKP